MCLGTAKQWNYSKALFNNMFLQTFDTMRLIGTEDNVSWSCWLCLQSILPLHNEETYIRKVYVHSV